MQAIEYKGLVPEPGFEPGRLAARDFKSVEAPLGAGKLLNYKGSGGTIQPYFEPERGTKRGTDLYSPPCPSAPTPSPSGKTASSGPPDSSAIRREPSASTPPASTRWILNLLPKPFPKALRSALTSRLRMTSRLSGLRTICGKRLCGMGSKFGKSISFRGSWSVFVGLVLLAPLCGIASLAQAEDISYQWKFSKPIKLNETLTVSRLTLYLDPEKMDQPYFPVYGGVSEKVGVITAWMDPVDGSCRVFEGVNFVCEVRNSAVELRLTKTGSSSITVYATEHSRMGAQGPYVMAPE
jgi:hypothetical protein